MILYLHGFRSSPASIKARMLAAHMQARGLGELFRCPTLPPAPAEAIALLEDEITRIRAAGHAPTLVGSSLGGYYATWLAEKHDLPAVLVNPSVVSYLSLASYLGEQSNLYTGEHFLFTEEHIAQLRTLEPPAELDPGRYWLLVETGDEVLDYRQAVERYAGARQTVLPGGDHGFSRWADYLDEVLRFAGLLS